jgi:diacylglycerol kinase family enzyme
MWFKPKPFNKKNIEIIKGCSVHIITGHKVHFQVDGEYKGKVKEVKAEILPLQLNLIVPKEITP